MAPTNKKKAKKSGFAVFVRERMAALKEEGVSFPNGFQDAKEMMGSEWDKLSAKTQAEYKEAARKGHVKKTTFWFTISQIEDIQRTKRLQKFERHIQCRAICDPRKDPCNKQIIMLKFTPYSHTANGEYIPAEVGMVTFSLRDGIIDNYSALIDPGKPPLGSCLEFVVRCANSGLPMPPFSEYCRDYRRILKKMQTYIDAHPPCLEGKKILFCTRPDTAINESCLRWLYNACGVPEPEGDDKYALRPIGLLFLHMYRNGSEFYDRLKEAEMLLSPGTMAESLSQKLVHKCGVPFFNIDDGRTRTRQLNGVGGAQVYDAEEDADQSHTNDQLVPNDLLAIAELTTSWAQNQNSKNGRHRRARPTKGNPQPRSVIGYLGILKNLANEESRKKKEPFNTKSKGASVPTILEENEDDDDSTSEPEQLQQQLDVPDSAERYENCDETLPETEENMGVVMLSCHAGVGTYSRATHKKKEFIKSIQQPNVAPIPKADKNQMLRTVGLCRMPARKDWWYGLVVPGQKKLYSFNKYVVDENIESYIYLENEVNNDSEEENSDPGPGPSKLDQNNIATTVEVDDNMPLRREGIRAAIWSQPLRARQPGEPEKYGDVDPLLVILNEVDAMEYLRSLDCAYIAEICCPHHTANNEICEKCPLNFLNRIALNFLDIQIGFWNIKPVEGKHYPYRDVTLEGQKRMDWSKRVFGHKQYGYKDIPFFKDSGEFKHDDEDTGAKSPDDANHTDTHENDFSGVFYKTSSSGGSDDEPYNDPLDDYNKSYYFYDDLI